MKVIIVEDDLIVADHLKMMLKRNEVNVIGIIDNVKEAIASTNLSPDLYFIDIRLDGKETGIDLGIYLSETNIPFIYLTANNEVAMMKSAAQTKPFAYITKPYKENDIIAMLEIYKAQFSKSIEVKTQYGKKQVKLNDILYFEAEGSYVKIVTLSTYYTERGTLTEFEDKFGQQFSRAHRSFLVNNDKIEQFNSLELYINGKAIPVSRGYKSNIETILKNKASI